MGWEARSSKEYSGTRHGHPVSCSTEAKHRNMRVGATNRPGVSATSSGEAIGKPERKGKRYKR